MTRVARSCAPKARSDARRGLGHLAAVVALGGSITAGVAVSSTQVAAAATDTVTNCSGSALTAGSLPYEVANASNGSTINFALSPACSLIVLTSPIAITQNVSIDGPGQASLTVSGGGTTEILDVESGIVGISGLTVNEGTTTAGLAGTTVAGQNGGNGGNGGDGGGIYNAGTLTLTNSTVSDNTTGAGGAGGYGYSGTGNGTGGSGGNGGDGGGIYNTGTLTLTGDTISGNSTGSGGTGGSGDVNGANAGNGGNGAAIYSSGVLTLNDGTVTDDVTGTGGAGGSGAGSAGPGGSGGNGGAILNTSSGTVTASDSTIAEDSTGAGGDAGGGNGGSTGGSGGNGGGIDSSGFATISDTTVANDDTGGGSGSPGGESIGETGGDGGDGGGIATSGTITLDNDTVAGDETGPGANGDSGSAGVVGGNGGNGGSGGGIYSSGSTTLANDTVAYYDVEPGGSGATGTDVSGTNGSNGVGGGIDNTGGATTLTATIVAASFAGSACSGGVTDHGYNIDDDGTCGFSAPSISHSHTLDSALGALTPNGGPTETIPLLAGSPAIKKVIPSADCPNPDQRGAKRKASCDIGAYSTRGNPKIKSFSPTKAKPGKLVTINGAHFAGATAVTFDGIAAVINTDSRTAITAYVPAGATTGRISVTTAVGGTVTSLSIFTVK